MDSHIQVSKLGKQYDIGVASGSYRTIREAIHDAFHKHPKETFWALRDVSFSVPQGQILGVIGSNGAGKSTLLKILSRVTCPTEGRARLRGRVGAILEVGTGFHPELTGRENIFLNGAILGMSRTRIRDNFDNIVQFAEIEKFIDTPVKFYSSGMYTKLAFAVSAHLEPEILLIDEVLAVGDINFQKKCLTKMSDVASEGHTILFVSHNMGAIVGLCQRVLWIKDGTLHRDGNPSDVVSEYVDASSSGLQAAQVSEDGSLRIERVVIKNQDGKETNQIRSGETLTVEIHFSATRRIEKPRFMIGIGIHQGSLFAANSSLDGIVPDFIEGTGVISARFHKVRLMPQVYSLNVGVRDCNGSAPIIRSYSAGVFKILDRARELGLTGPLAEHLAWQSAPILIHYDWIFPDGKEVSVFDEAFFKRT